MFTFSKKYFAFFLILFFVEVLIALFLRDGFVRPYVGDYLVVILLYCFVRSFLALPPFKIAVAVLLFAYLVEVAQYFRIVEWLGLSQNQLAHVVIGTGFEWFDLVAYTVGTATVLLLDKKAVCQPVR